MYFSKGHVDHQSLSVYKWYLKRAGPGVVPVKAPPGQKKKSPACNKFSTKYKAFSARVKAQSGSSATVYDFSKDRDKIETGVELLNEAVYTQPPDAVANYNPAQQEDAPQRGGDDGEEAVVSDDVE